MKPFDLEQALAGKPVVTRNGLPVPDVHLFGNASGKFCVGAVIKGEVFLFTLEGKTSLSGESELDLLMSPEKRMVWLNIFDDLKTLEYIAVGFNSRESAGKDPSSRYARFVAIPVEVEV